MLFTFLKINTSSRLVNFNKVQAKIVFCIKTSSLTRKSFFSVSFPIRDGCGVSPACSCVSQCNRDHLPNRSTDMPMNIPFLILIMCSVKLIRVQSNVRYPDPHHCTDKRISDTTLTCYIGVWKHERHFQEKGPSLPNRSLNTKIRRLHNTWISALGTAKRDEMIHKMGTTVIALRLVQIDFTFMG